MEKAMGQGLVIADKYYKDYGCRAKELKEEGKGVMGYFSALTPVEIISAAGFIPVRMKGNVNEPMTRADAYMETIVCPFG